MYSKVVVSPLVLLSSITIIHSLSQQYNNTTLARTPKCTKLIISQHLAQQVSREEGVEKRGAKRRERVAVCRYVAQMHDAAA